MYLFILYFLGSSVHPRYSTSTIRGKVSGCRLRERVMARHPGHLTSSRHPGLCLPLGSGSMEKSSRRRITGILFKKFYQFTKAITIRKISIFRTRNCQVYYLINKIKKIIMCVVITSHMFVIHQSFNKILVIQCQNLFPCFNILLCFSSFSECLPPERRRL